MLAYFNELSANGNLREELLPGTIKTLVACLQSLMKKQVNGVNLDKKISDYQLTSTKWFQHIFDDKSILDNDMKTLILGMMTTTENPMNRLKEEGFDEATCDGVDCIGLALASEEVYNTFTISLSSNDWDNSTYSIKLQQLLEKSTQELEINTIDTECKNVSLLEHIEQISDFLVSIPSTGVELSMRLSELYPNLIFSSKAISQIRKNHDRPAVEQIYLKLKDINWAAGKLEGKGLRRELFRYITCPEHEQRSQLPEMNIKFKDGITRNCEWHMKYTPGCGRIHFSVEHSDGHTIYIGHVDKKIGIH